MELLMAPFVVIGLVLLILTMPFREAFREIDQRRQIKEVDTAMAHFRQELGKVRIGDSKDTVLSVLSPTQSGLRSEWQKPPQSYDAGGHLLDIYYVLTNLVPDHKDTDDQFTPLIFRDGILVSIGWRRLSGPDTFGGMTH